MQTAEFFRGVLEHPFRFLIGEHNATASVDLEDRVGSRFQKRRWLDDGLIHGKEVHLNLPADSLCSLYRTHTARMRRARSVPFVCPAHNSSVRIHGSAEASILSHHAQHAVYTRACVSGAGRPPLHPAITILQVVRFAVP